MQQLALALIAVYRRWISPLKPQCCRYMPTCSGYAAEAVATHGVARGAWLATRRILRCHPWGGGGWDPVPPARQAQGACDCDASRAKDGGRAGAAV